MSLWIACVVAAPATLAGSCDRPNTRAHLDPVNVARRAEAERLIQFTTGRDYRQAELLLYEAGAEGDALARLQHLLVRHTYLEEGNAQPWKGFARDVLDPVMEMANAGDKEAALAIARYHHDFVTGEEEEMFSLAQAAASDKYVPGYRFLGHLWEIGFGTPVDAGKALENYKVAAEAGDAASAYRLGLIYADAEGEHFDAPLAFYWYGKAAEREYLPAYYALAWCHDTGVGTRYDAAAALENYERSAEAGDTQGMYALGMIYWYGNNGVKQDLARAREYLEKASALGAEDARDALKYFDSGEPLPRKE